MTKKIWKPKVSGMRIKTSKTSNSLWTNLFLNVLGQKNAETKNFGSFSRIQKMLLIKLFEAEFFR